jgi:hypothetical protein
MLRIDQKNLSAVPSRADIPNQGRADGPLPGTGSDDCHGGWMENFIQVVDAHEEPGNLEVRSQQSE